MRSACLVLLLSVAVSGCVVGDVAKTAVNVAAVPVKVVGKGIDAALPNQKKADEKRGRELRKADEQRAKDERKMADRCRKNRPLPTDSCFAPQTVQR